MASHVLDNIAWHSLAGEHARHALGDAQVRRYRAGFAPLAAFADPANADAARLSRWFLPGETAFVAGARVESRSAGWRTLKQLTAQQMLWLGGARPPRDTHIDAVVLQPRHAAAMVELARSSAPGPFAERAVELGRFYGVFDGARLVAMAGQRMRAGGHVELSAVCTAASHRRRGLARALITCQLADGVAPGDRPFLHVAEHNHSAIALYESLGFRRRCRVALSMLQRDEAPAECGVAASEMAL